MDGIGHRTLYLICCICTITTTYTFVIASYNDICSPIRCILKCSIRCTYSLLTFCICCYRTFGWLHIFQHIEIEVIVLLPIPYRYLFRRLFTQLDSCFATVEGLRFVTALIFQISRIGYIPAFPLYQRRRTGIIMDFILCWHKFRILSIFKIENNLGCNTLQMEIVEFIVTRF